MIREHEDARHVHRMVWRDKKRVVCRLNTFQIPRKAIYHGKQNGSVNHDPHLSPKQYGRCRCSGYRLPQAKVFVLVTIGELRPSTESAKTLTPLETQISKGGQGPQEYHRQRLHCILGTRWRRIMPSHNIFRNKLHLYSNVHKEIYDDDDKIVEYYFLLNCILHAFFYKNGENFSEPQYSQFLLKNEPDIFLVCS